MTEAQQERLIELAREALDSSRDSLIMNLRYMDLALDRLEYHPIEVSSLLTDGDHLLFHPEHVMKNFRSDGCICTRDYLHVVLHCVFRHMYPAPALDRPLWDLACDIAVETVICEMDIAAVEAPRQSSQLQYIRGLKHDIGQLTAENIYRALLKTEADGLKAADLRAAFYADDHEIWYMTAEEIEQRFGLSPNGPTTTSKSESEQAWQEISSRMETELASFGKLPGTTPGDLLQNLSEVNRERYDYTAFLKKFAVLGEVMQINDEEFDYIYYTYGMKLYKKMPLIEPLEYTQVKRIRDFVIAIDTSGSTSGELVQKFVQKTYNILKSTESFFSKINLYIIQCDAVIQEAVKITSQEEFDDYLKHMQIHGLGGTDFRPVFDYVDKLRASKELTDLKGLIYLTDGFGEFPRKRPDYETAVVYIEDGRNNPTVPPWAIKLILRSNEI